MEKAKAAQKAKETRSNFLHFAATRCSLQGGAAAETPQAVAHSPTCAALSIRPARRPVAAARSESERPRWQQRGAFPVCCTAYTCGCGSVVKTNRHTAQYHRRQHRLTRSLARTCCAHGTTNGAAVVVPGCYRYFNRVPPTSIPNPLYTVLHNSLLHN